MIIVSKENMKAVTVTSFKVVSDLSNAAEKEIEAIERRVGLSLFMSDLAIQPRIDAEIEAYLERSDNAYVHYINVNGENFDTIYGKKDYGKTLFNNICNAIEKESPVYYL